MGAGITLVSSVLTQLLQHILSVRQERIRFQMEKERRETEERKSAIMSGVTGYTIKRRIIELEELRKKGE